MSINLKFRFRNVQDKNSIHSFDATKIKKEMVFTEREMETKKLTFEEVVLQASSLHVFID